MLSRTSWRRIFVAFFAYYSRQLGGKAYLCVRKIKNTGIFKPYAIIDQNMFDAEIQNLRKLKTAELIC